MTGFFHTSSGNEIRKSSGFSLIELLVVMGIIGVLASVSLPAIRGISRANSLTAANRQIIDDLAYARLRALNARATVYMVFVPTNIAQRIAAERIPSQDTNGVRQLRNLFTGQYVSYALVADRSVGDQPGKRTPRYLTEWKTLPEGAMFGTNKFSSTDSYEYERRFDFVRLPFPNSRSQYWNLPCIAFNPAGQLSSMRDELIPIGQGSVLYERDKDEVPVVTSSPDIVIAPPRNYTNNYIRVNWLTGRAAIERPKEFQ